MTQQIYQHKLDNGLTLLAEDMPWLESAAFAILVPAGAVHDPPGRMGLNNLLCDMAQRGAGTRNSRQFAESLDRLGVDRNASVSLTHSSFTGATLADNLLPALELVADQVLQPLLPAEQLEESRQVCFQELRAMEDDLGHRTIEQVRALQYPAPWSRSVQGRVDDVQQISMDDVRDQYAKCYRPDQAIISVAGRIDWDALKSFVQRRFGSWTAGTTQSLTETPSTGSYHHEPYDSQQTHLAIAYPSVPYRHPDYYQARAAVGVLSDGMSSRLFTEVREKEGLCYTIYASLNTLRDQGSVICYSATTTDRAQETLDITLHELKRLGDGIEEAELQRLKARIKSALIMQQESSTTRCVSMAIDWFHLGLVRSMTDVSQQVNALSAESINRFLQDNPPGEFRVASLGAQPLEVQA